jgi:hypothetical protein
MKAAAALCRGFPPFPERYTWIGWSLSNINPGFGNTNASGAEGFECTKIGESRVVVKGNRVEQHS